MPDNRRPDHAPAPGMDLKMKGSAADAVNREAFAARQDQVKKFGNHHASGGGEKATPNFSQKASQAYQQSTTSQPGSKAGRGNLSAEASKAGKTGTAKAAFNKANRPPSGKSGMGR
ncbi:hypothetical protein [Sphingomonas sp.]|uniref:hypothetical protein n=1 Tax=Sphingomonas sp. TaxID=28214 RepID=UPI001B10EC40|nr:hypothetical protein [Sphingomonas sp.]MBO9712683.1 hypothetical protein [Sphingomonas sp.]